jgi:hypothetical protein
MLNAILVLRIHLIELEKVNELCTDFADHYIETLKLKLNSDNIFKCDEDEDLNETADGLDPNETKSLEHVNKKMKKIEKSKSKSNGIKSTSNLDNSFDISNETSLSKIKFNMLNLNNNNYENSSNQSVVSNETDSEDKLDQNDESLNNDDNFELNDDIDESLDENNNNYDDDTYDNNSLTRSPAFLGKSSSSSSSIVNKSNHDDKNSSKSKRGILPKNATNVMKRWLFQHIVVSKICF